MKTGILWLIVFFFGSIASYVRGPIYALLIYMFTYYTLFSWGTWAKRLTGGDRLSLYAGILLIISFILQKAKLPQLLSFKNPSLIWLILLCFNMMFLSLIALDPIASKYLLTQFLKIVLLYYLIVKIVRDKISYKLFVWVQVWGNFLLGWQAFDVGKMDGGRLYNVGAPGIRESNFLAAHFLLCLPLVGKFILWGKRYEKIICLIAAVFIINALVLCNSRGSFVALLVMTGLSFILSKKGMRKKLIIGLLVGLFGFTFIANEQFWMRMSTIQTYEEDRSATSRIDGWKAAISMMKDYPLGAGGGGWDAHGRKYLPNLDGDSSLLTIHNTYLMMGTDWGIQGLFFYLAFIFTTLKELHAVRKRCGSKDDNFYFMESIAIELGIIGFMVAAFFLSRIYAEGVYWYCALAIALGNIQQNEIIEEEKNKSQVKQNPTRILPN